MNLLLMRGPFRFSSLLIHNMCQTLQKSKSLNKIVSKDSNTNGKMPEKVDGRTTMTDKYLNDPGSNSFEAEQDKKAG